MIDALIEWLRNSADKAKTDTEWTKELIGDIQSEKPEIKLKKLLKIGRILFAKNGSKQVCATVTPE